jgi:hypothetical protein
MKGGKARMGRGITGASLTLTVSDGSMFLWGRDLQRMVQELSEEVTIESAGGQQAHELA